MSCTAQIVHASQEGTGGRLVGVEQKLGRWPIWANGEPRPLWLSAQTNALGDGAEISKTGRGVGTTSLATFNSVVALCRVGPIPMKHRALHAGLAWFGVLCEARPCVFAQLRLREQYLPYCLT